MFDFRQITLFRLKYRSQSTDVLYVLKIWRGHGPLGPLATPMVLQEQSRIFVLCILSHNFG